MLTREILSGTWSEAFGEVFVLHGVNTDLMLRTWHVLVLPDQGRS